MTEIAVWWLRPEDVAQLTGHKTHVDLLLRLGVPDYIADEVRNSVGRAGRGRLWVPSEITVNKIEWNDAHRNAKRASESAGIMVWKRDLGLLNGLPGLLTDAWLNPL